MTSFFFWSYMQDREIYINAIKSAFIKLAKEKVISYLISQSAFFTLPVIGPLVSLAVEKILTIAITAANTGIFFAYVDLRTANQSAEFSEAALRNYLAQQSGNPKEIEYAEINLIHTFNDFVKFNRI